MKRLAGIRILGKRLFLENYLLFSMVHLVLFTKFEVKFISYIYDIMKYFRSLLIKSTNKLVHFYSLYLVILLQ